MDRLDHAFRIALHRRWLVPTLMGLVLVLQYLILKRQYLLTPAPAAALAVLAMLYLRLEAIWVVALGMLSLSLPLESRDSFGITLPSDFIAILLLLVSFLKARTFWGTLLDSLRHPVVYLSLAYLFWLLICVVASELPLISFKFWLNYVWYFTGFFVFSLVLFQRRPEWQVNWVKAVAPVFVLMAFIVMFKHSQSGFGFLASYEMMKPFFREHTVYAAYVAFFTLAFWVMWQRQTRLSAGWWWWGGVSLVATLALLLSYTRGAWLGAVVAAGVWLLLKYWRFARWVALAVVAVLAFGIWELSGPNLSYKDANAENRSIGQHLTTAFDTEENVSNRERLNRWVAALKMFEERPVFGFGPGTYSFTYAPHQEAQWQTYVSTNQGDIGSAHNEYLLALSESGWPGALILLLLVIVSTTRAVRGYRRTRHHPHLRSLYALVLTGLLTFYVHAIVNNFLDQDKLAIPVFLSWALLVVLDTQAAAPKSGQAPESGPLKAVGNPEAVG